MQSENTVIEKNIAIELSKLIKSYLLWVQQETQGKNLFYLAREGWTLSKYNQILHTQNKTNLIRSSRILLNSINISTRDDIIKEIKKPSSDCRIQDFLKFRFGIGERTEVDFFKNLPNDKLKRREIEDILLNSRTSELFLNFLLEHNKERKKRVMSYYRNHFSDANEINLIDIGYNGSFRKALSKMFPNKKFTGYYIGTLDNSEPQDNGFLFEKKNNNNTNLNIENNVLFLEYLLSTNDGTTLDIDQNFNVTLANHTKQTKVETIQKISLNNILHVDTNYSLDFILNPNKETAIFFKDEFIEDLYRGKEKHFLISKRKLKLTNKQKENFIKESAWRNGAFSILNNR